MKLFIAVVCLCFLSNNTAAQRDYRFICSPKDVVPATCLEQMKVADVNKPLSTTERRQLCQLFIQAHRISMSKYKQDYLIEPNAAIYRLFKNNFPDVAKLEGEGGIYLGNIYKFIQSQPEYVQLRKRKGF